jgi:F0F1-type ATP synthase membrane subunit a
VLEPLKCEQFVWILICNWMPHAFVHVTRETLFRIHTTSTTRCFVVFVLKQSVLSTKFVEL